MFLGTTKQAEHQNVLFHNQFNHDAQLVTALCEHLLEGLCLSNRAREAVEDDALACGLSVVRLGKNLNHEVIGNELAFRDIALSYFAQLCSVLDFGTQHVACADVTHAVPCYNLVAVGALA